MQLAGKHVVVTGSARGIGEAMAMAVAAAGAKVTTMDINIEGAEATAAAIRAAGGQAQAVACDITKMASVEAALAQAVAGLGPVTTLVANAGGAAGKRSSFLELDEEKWHDMMDRNLTGNFHCGLVFARYMAAEGGGSIVFTSSIAADFASPGLPHYGAAKGGVKMLMRCMALELAEHKIRVNAVAPGVCITPGNEMILNTPVWAEQIKRTVPLGRAAKTTELGGAVVFLASDAASYVTGSTIVVDGGLTLQ